MGDVDGDGGMEPGVCCNPSESAALGDRTRSLVLVSYFRTVPLGATAYVEHSRGLAETRCARATTPPAAAGPTSWPSITTGCY
jgi:hypothetical protein